MITSFKILIPLTKVQPPKTFIDDLVDISPTMINNYNTYFKQAAQSSNLPISVLYSVAMIESTGNHYSNGSKVYVSGSERSVGIMQISPDSFYETLKNEIPANRLSDLSISLIKKYIPTFVFTKGSKINSTASKQTLDSFFVALKNVDFNILASAIVLRRLLEQTADSDGTMRLDKAIIKYNVGEYSKATKTPAFSSGDTTNLMRNGALPNITVSYIAKAVGKNGAMEFFIKKGY